MAGLTGPMMAPDMVVGASAGVCGCVRVRVRLRSMTASPGSLSPAWDDQGHLGGRQADIDRGLPGRRYHLTGDLGCEVLGHAC